MSQPYRPEPAPALEPAPEPELEPLPPPPTVSATGSGLSLAFEPPPCDVTDEEERRGGASLSAPPPVIAEPAVTEPQSQSSAWPTSQPVESTSGRRVHAESAHRLAPNASLPQRHAATVATHRAFLMAGHPRLGAASPAGVLTADLLEYIIRLKQATEEDNAYLLLVGGMTRTVVIHDTQRRYDTQRLWSCTDVTAVHIPTGRSHTEATLPHDLSGHIAICVPVLSPTAADRENEATAPLDCCAILGGFEDVSRTSARCHQLRLRSAGDGEEREAVDAWGATPAMIDPRHGGFAGALVRCSGVSATAGLQSPGLLLPCESSVLAVAGGQNGPLRSGGTVLNTAEWLCAARGRWYPLGRMSSARYGCAGASLPNQLIALGGSAGRNNLASVEAIDLRVGTWRDLAPLPQALYGCAASTLSLDSSTEQRTIVICGGCDDSRAAVSATYIYDIRADSWTKGGSLEIARMCHAVAAVPRRSLPPSTLLAPTTARQEHKHSLPQRAFQGYF